MLAHLVHLGEKRRTLLFERCLHPSPRTAHNQRDRKANPTPLQDQTTPMNSRTPVARNPWVQAAAENRSTPRQMANSQHDRDLGNRSLNLTSPAGQMTTGRKERSKTKSMEGIRSKTNTSRMSISYRPIPRGNLPYKHGNRRNYDKSGSTGWTRPKRMPVHPVIRTGQTTMGRRRNFSM